MTMPPQEPTPRTEGPTPRADEARAVMAGELAGLAEAVNILVEHIDQSLPEERVKQLADAVLADERSGRRRLTATVVGALALILIVAISSLVQSASNGRTLSEAKTVSDYVKHCLIAPAPHDPVQCGVDNSANFLKGLIGALNCSLLIPPLERSEAKLNACAAKAFGG
jgi:hypothetical protein